MKYDLKSFNVIFALLLFAVSFVLRARWIGVDVYGDESWYFHLARTLGTGVQTEDLPFGHFLSRPMLPLCYWPFAQINFQAFRWVNIFLGSLIPVLGFFTALSMNIPRKLSLAGGVLLCIHPVLTSFSALVFQDTLGCFFALAAIPAFEKKNYLAAAILTGAALVVKESFAVNMLAMGLISISFQSKFPFIKSSRFTYYLFLASIPYIICSALAFIVVGSRLPGWATEQPGIVFWSQMYINPLTIPLLFALIFLGKPRHIILTFCYPLFFLAWSYMLNKGVNNWYTIGPCVFVLMGILKAAFLLCNETLQVLKNHAIPRGRHAWTICAVIVGITVGTGLYVSKGNIFFTTLKLSNPPKDSPLTETVNKFSGLNSANCLLVDTFWAYRYFPFGEIGAPVDILATSTKTEKEVFQFIKDYDYLVIEKQPCNLNLRIHLYTRNVFNNRNYMIVKNLPPHSKNRT